MSAADARSGEDHGFGLVAVGLMVLIGVVGFVGMFVIGAFAPEMGVRRNGGTNALSTSAVGFSGIVRLAAETGRNPVILRNEHATPSEDLLVLTPPDGSVNLDRLLNPRQAKATLIILPKWDVASDPRHDGWVQRQGLFPHAVPEGVMAPAYKFHVTVRKSGGARLLVDRDLPSTIRFTAPRPLQLITRTDLVVGSQDGRRIARGQLRPLVVDRQGGIVVAQVDGRPFYIVADPDLFSNLGIADPQRAESALALLDWMNSTGAKSIQFDVTLNGLGRKPSLLELAVTPPFLALTVGLFVAAILAGFHGLGRFGPALVRPRSLAFGKAALIENTAALVRLARRQREFGARYAAMVRDRAVIAYGVPPRLRDGALDEYLDRLRPDARFSDLAARAAAATTPREVAEAALALHLWERTMA